MCTLSLHVRIPGVPSCRNVSQLVIGLHHAGHFTETWAHTVSRPGRMLGFVPVSGRSALGAYIWLHGAASQAQCAHLQLYMHTVLYNIRP